jgi:hypothetical protein
VSLRTASVPSFVAAIATGLSFAPIYIANRMTTRGAAVALQLIRFLEIFN